MFRVIIAGSRTFTDYFRLEYLCDHYLRRLEPKSIRIVCGMQRGADECGYRYAGLRGYPVDEFPYRSEFGKFGGHVRNQEMAVYAFTGPVGGCLIAFHIGNSPGTASMIEYADAIGLPYRVVKF